eukprot:8495104-Pyramimonas_sp.AAC.1
MTEDPNTPGYRTTCGTCSCKDPKAPLGGTVLSTRFPHAAYWWWWPAARATISPGPGPTGDGMGWPGGDRGTSL